MGRLCRNFHMLCDRQFQYTLVLLYICVKTYNVHGNKKYSVFHIFLFGERYDFVILILVAAVYQQIFSSTEQGFIGLLSGNQTSMFYLGGGSCNFQPCFRGGSVIFVPKGGVGHVFFINHISKCSGPTPPPPPPLYFLTSPLINC